MRSKIAFPGSLLLLSLAACDAGGRATSNDVRTPGLQSGFSVVEASFLEMQRAMETGQVTSRQIVQQYLDRIATYDPTLKASLAINPGALDEADRLDRERAAGRVRGPMHGIPVALKDLINTTDMPTTGGLYAFEGYIPPYEATLVGNLREAGAIIIAKTSLTELANWMGETLPEGFSALGGYGMNPYDPRPDPRESDGRCVMSPGSSSAGNGTAANLWAANVGTETDGSILWPAETNMLAAIKPTTGRISRHGIMPLTADQDTAGPMARSVADAAILLGAMEGAFPDPMDPATSVCQPPPGRDYTPHLRRDGLRNARIGIPRAFYYEELPADQMALLEEAIAILEREGAVIVDPVEIPSIVATEPDDSLLHWNICWQTTEGRGSDEHCTIVLKYGVKRDFNAYLASLGSGAPVHSLTELREFNLAHAERAIPYGQSMLDLSDEMEVERDRVRYQADRAKDLRLTKTQGLDAVFAAHQLDAVLFPGSNGYEISARPGYPTVIVPLGTYAADASGLPTDFDPQPWPFSISFAGLACSEPRLIEMAYAFEQATLRRAPPASFR
jgi:amidase